MDKRIQRANHYAQMSCTRWNKPKLKKGSTFYPISAKYHGASRRHYRAKYRAMAEDEFFSPEHQALVKYYKAGNIRLDTYLPLFKNPEFANWDESADPDDYSLISDPSGCVIRYATSYCAYKIFEEIGEWPQKKTSRRLDARDWVQFLAEAGYSKNWVRPMNGHRFVGIEPNNGEWGLVVWFEEEVDGIDDMVHVSTYVDKEYQFYSARYDRFVWIQIS